MRKTMLAGLLAVIAIAEPGRAQTDRPSAPARGARVVHVAQPTGEQEADRASIVAALEQAAPGDTIQFAPGTYVVGPLVPVSTPRLVLVGHPEGTTLRGCDPAGFDAGQRELVEAMRSGDGARVAAIVSGCGMLQLSGGHTTVRNLTLEYTSLGLMLGCCPLQGVMRPDEGGYRIEGNTFRNSGNGIRPDLFSTAPTVIRGNRFVNVYHAVSAAASHVHVLENDISAPEPRRVPGQAHPGGAIGLTTTRNPADTAAGTFALCAHNIIAGNRIDGHPDGILILALPGTSCRQNVIRDNTITVRRVPLPALRSVPGAVAVANEADSTIVGVPLELENVRGVPGQPRASDAEGVIEGNLIEGNRLIGADGLGMIIYHASRNRIVNNTITGVLRRHPFPGNTLAFPPARWREANGSGIWVSAGSNGNDIAGNTFEDIAAHAIVLQGDSNVVRTRGASDAVRDAGNANRVTGSPGNPPGAPSAVANDNRTPAGMLVGDTLVVHLVVSPAAWHIHDEKAGAFSVLAFAEEGKPPTIPAPLIRVAAGTTIQVAVQNPLADSLIVHGLGTRGDGVPDSLIVPPGVTRRSRFSAGPEGTYLYWATTTDVPPRGRTLPGRALNTRQLAGAFVIDPPGKTAPDDRIFVITQHLDQDISGSARPLFDRGLFARDFPAINGKSWPHTERLTYALGDSIRWRVINASFRPHPMHLHGFYFRVDAKGNALRDRDVIYSPAERAMAVTEVIQIGETMAMVWSPDRPGGWIFHCHITQHAALQPPVDRRDALEFPPHHAHSDPDRHALTGMNGLVVGVTVRGKASAPGRWRPARQFRLFVQSDSAPNDSTRRFGYVLQRGATEPARDSVEFPGPVLVLTRGEPTSIQVVNRTGEPTAVHWHGIELESYYDGIVGWSGTPGARTAPAIRPGASFEVRITPRRAGTFMYHTHFDELRQQFGGLVGAIVVREPGERWDPERDRVFMLSDGLSRGAELDRVALQLGPFGRDLAINGSVAPPPMELRVGTTYRFRFANLLVDRPLLHVRLVRDSTLLSWRRVAKDGFALSGAQPAARPSPEGVGSGETVDLEYTPDRPGDLMLEFGAGPRFPYVFARLRVHVRESLGLIARPEPFTTAFIQFAASNVRWS